MSWDLRQVKVILFDAGDTLFQVKGGVGAVYAEVARRSGVHVEPSLIQRRFFSLWGKMPPLVFPGASSRDLPRLERAWWRGLVAGVFEGVAFADFDRFFDAVYAEFEGETGWELFPETKETLRHLKGAGYRLGIVSNFDSRLFTICERLGIQGFFDSIITSTDVGVAKPQPLIFRKALDRFGVAAPESAFVGDSPAHDLAGARTVGMVPVLVDRSGRLPGEPGIRIESLEPLIGLFP